MIESMGMHATARTFEDNIIHDGCRKHSVVSRHFFVKEGGDNDNELYTAVITPNQLILSMGICIQVK